MRAQRAWVLCDTPPDRSGSGYALRVFSNVRALSQLGFQAEVIAFDPRRPAGALSSPFVPAIPVSNTLWAPRAATIPGKVAYRLGTLTSAGLVVRYPGQAAIRETIASLPIRWPDDLVVTEGPNVSSALARLQAGVPTISYHDDPLATSAATMTIACELAQRGPSASERRELRFLREFDRWLLARQPRCWTITSTDRDRLRRLPGGSCVAYLPLSAPEEHPFRLGQPGPEGPGLHLLHLGATAHLPSYSSLRWLLETVWPTLPASTRDRITLNVVGRIDPEHPRSRKLLDLAAPYPSIRFHGFVQDIRSAYLGNHAQIVVSTMAEGARTRVIESLAAGLPVIATPLATAGLEGLEPEGLLTCADAEVIGSTLTRLAEDRASLDDIAQQGRSVYDTAFSQVKVRERLGAILREWGHPVLGDRVRATGASPSR